MLQPAIQIQNSVAHNASAEARLLRRYVELENKQSWHTKASIVQQAGRSRYQLTETQLGGMTTRHDLTISQVRTAIVIDGL